MSVVEKPVTETVVRSPDRQLALSSLLGAVYVLAALWVFFAGLAYVWGLVVQIENQFLSAALLLIVNLAVGIGLWYVGYQLEKKNTQHGLRAGVFFGALFLYLDLWLSIAVVGDFLAWRDMGIAGLVIALGILVGLVYLIVRMFLNPGFAEWLRGVEDQGWFHALPYKPTQGVRVRRGTVLGLLTIGIAGIITLINHGTLGRERITIANEVIPNNWEWVVPFAREFVDLPVNEEVVFTLMYKVHLVLPLVLGGLLIWFAWRVVNFPAFADFLIATEAEMNKVSWTTRKRLVQDTIVVLVTVFLFTAFLFVVDIIWIKVLSWRPIGVLQVDVKAEREKQQEKTQW